MRQRLPEWEFVALMILALAVCYLIARPFVTSVAWATALAVISAPLHRRIERRIGHKSLAAACSVCLLTLFLGVLLGAIIPIILTEAHAGFVRMKGQIESNAWNEALDRHGWIRPAWEWFQFRIDVSDVVERATLLLASLGSFAVRWSFVAMVEIALTVFFLFYFLRDRERLLASLRSMLPTSPAESNRIFDVAGATIFATAYGTVLVAVVQGFLGGLMFWWLGISAPWFWAVIMAMLSIIRLLGPPLVWIPAAVFLFLQGQWQHAALLVVWGTLVVGIADNLLYPIVVAKYLHLHAVLLLVSVIGGLLLFGSSGLFLGPVLLAVTMTLLEIWRERAQSLPTVDAAIT